MAIVNKIINFSCVDGPGNRMVIFFQGCNFECTYCHNPETINKCTSCGECVEGCGSNALSIENGKVLWDEDECINCDRCIKVCKHLSSPKVKDYSVEELLEKIEKDRFFIRGITVSGGECTLNQDFLIELFTEVKKLGLTCFIDTNGSQELQEELIKVTDGFMLDVKSVDKDTHMVLTQHNNTTVLKNLDLLLKKDKIFEVRTVIAPNLDSEKTVRFVANKIKDKCRYKLIKYREYGVREKGIKFHENESPDLEFMRKLEMLVRNINISEIVIS